LRNKVYTVIAVPVLAGLLFLFPSAPVRSQPAGAAVYNLNDDGQPILNLILSGVDEPRIRATVEDGGKSEILLTFRINIDSAGPGIELARSTELRLRRTGFRDIITGDYVLLLNGREAGIYRTWDDFYRGFICLCDYPLGDPLQPGDFAAVRYRMEVVYRKLVAPINLLYFLLPGKFVQRGGWTEIPSGPEI